MLLTDGSKNDRPSEAVLVGKMAEVDTLEPAFLERVTSDVVLPGWIFVYVQHRGNWLQWRHRDRKKHCGHAPGLFGIPTVTLKSKCPVQPGEIT
jgi:hypothetical protein